MNAFLAINPDPPLRVEADNDQIHDIDEIVALLRRFHEVVGSPLCATPTTFELVKHLFGKDGDLYKKVFEIVYERNYQGYLKFLLTFFHQTSFHHGANTPELGISFQDVISRNMESLLSIDAYTSAWERIGSFRFPDGEWLWSKMETFFNEYHDMLYHFPDLQQGFCSSDEPSLKISTMETNGLQRFRHNDGGFALSCNVSRYHCFFLGIAWQRTSDESGEVTRSRLLQNLLYPTTKVLAKKRFGLAYHDIFSMERAGLIQPDTDTLPDTEAPLNDPLIPSLPSNKTQARVVASMLELCLYNISQVDVETENPKEAVIVALTRLLDMEG